MVKKNSLIILIILITILLVVFVVWAYNKRIESIDNKMQTNKTYSSIKKWMNGQKWNAFMEWGKEWSNEWSKNFLCVYSLKLLPGGVFLLIFCKQG